MAEMVAGQALQPVVNRGGHGLVERRRGEGEAKGEQEQRHTEWSRECPGLGWALVAPI
jgi:hypothetical protein